MGTKVAFPGRSLWRRLGRCLSRFIGAEVGSVAIIGAVMMPVIVLAAGLWIETGYWYSQQRKVQSAADVAAFAAGVRIRAGDLYGDEQFGGTNRGYFLAARQAATRSGFLLQDNESLLLNDGTRRIKVTFPYNQDANLVEVILIEDHQRYLTAIIPDALKSTENIRISGRAVVRLVGREATSGCVLALSRAGAGALSVSGSAKVSLRGCDLASNSVSLTASASVSGSSNLTVECVRAVGRVSNTTTGTFERDAGCPVSFAPPSRDPYASLKVPLDAMAAITTCPNMAGMKPINPNKPEDGAKFEGTPNAAIGAPVRCYEAPSGGSINIMGRVTLGPGLHIFRGNLRFTSDDSVLIGNGATLYFVDGASMTLNGNTKLLLKPPTPTTVGISSTYPYMGISILADRGAQSETFMINGTSNTISVEGAIYAPTSKIFYSGNSTMPETWNPDGTPGTNDGCLQIIAQTVEFTGSSYLASDCQGTGTKPLYSYETVELFE